MLSSQALVEFFCATHCDSRVSNASVRRRFPFSVFERRIQTTMVRVRRRQARGCLLRLAASLALFATSARHRRPNVRYQRHQTRHLRPMYAAAARHRPILRTRRDCSPSAREPSLTRGRARRTKAAARWPAETSGVLLVASRRGKPLMLGRATAPRHNAARKVLRARPAAGAA